MYFSDDEKEKAFKKQRQFGENSSANKGGKKRKLQINNQINQPNKRKRKQNNQNNRYFNFWQNQNTLIFSNFLNNSLLAQISQIFGNSAKFR